MTGEYLRTPDVEALTGIKSGTLRNWRARNVGPVSIKLRGVVVYPRGELETWMAAQAEATARGGDQ